MSNRLPQNLGKCMTQAVQYKVPDILVEGVNLSRDSYILHIEEEAIEEVKDFKARANSCWAYGEYGHFYRYYKAPNKQQSKSDHAPSVDERPTGQLKIGMESQQPLTALMVDQFMQMVLCEKRKTKFAVKKYKDLKNTNDDKMNTPAIQQPTTHKMVTTAPPIISPKKDLKSHVTKTTPKRIVTRGRSKSTCSNDDTTVPRANQTGPTWNTCAQVAAQWATSTSAVVTSYQGMIAAIVPDVVEENKGEGESKDDSINEMSVIESKSEEYLTDMSQWLPLPLSPTRLKKSYSPQNYYKDIEVGALCSSCNNSHKKYQVPQVIVGSSKGTTFPTKIGDIICNVLIDMGASRSRISESFYRQLNLPSFKALCRTNIWSGTGSNLFPLGIVKCSFTLGSESFTTEGIVRKHLVRPPILGEDFLRRNRIGIYY